MLTNIQNTPITAPNGNLRTRKMNNSERFNNPAFGKKPIEIDDKSWIVDKIKWLGEDFNSAMQRLVSGITAIVTQPFFDWNNKKTDEETRKTSTARTISKIIVGTTTGVAIREACIHATKNFTQNKNIMEYENNKALKKGKKVKTIPGNFTTRQQFLLPKKIKDTATDIQIRKYRGSIGTFAALFVMLFTNFLIDAPLTMFLTNKISPLFKKIPTQKREVSNDNSQ